MVNRLIPLQVETNPSVLSHVQGVFMPNATTRLLANGAKGFVVEANDILELGCGSGVIGLELWQLEFQRRGGQNPPRLFMSDVSSLATELAKRNAEVLEVPADVRAGSLFEPWSGMCFDLIVSDVSGVVPAIGQQLGWFMDVPNDSGADGTDLALSVISQSPQFLSSDGTLIMPVISLSLKDKIMDSFHETFSQVTLADSRRFPLGADPQQLKNIRRDYPSIGIEFVSGVATFSTEIYVLRTPKGQ